MAGLTILRIFRGRRSASTPAPGVVRIRRNLGALNVGDGRVVGGGQENQPFSRIRSGCSAVITSARAGNLHRIVLVTGRREDAFVARAGDSVLPRRALFRRQKIGIHIVRRHLLPRERRNHGGERLRGPGLLSRHVALRHRALFDGPQRLARNAIEDIEEAGLAGLRHCVNRLSIMPDGDQLRRRARIRIPQIVVNFLEMPQPLSSTRIEGYEAVAEQAHADAIRAIHVVGGRTEHYVHDAAFFIERKFAPIVHAADIFPRVLRPGFVTEFAGMRHGMEVPDQLCR